MSSILMFSNRSVKLFTLKNRFLITEKALHSIRMCLTMQDVRQVEHCGCGSRFKMKEWVSLVWPIHNRDITTCSLLWFVARNYHQTPITKNPYMNHHHHHHVVLVARIFLTLSRHFSLSFIASGRSSGQHPVSSHSYWMYVCGIHVQI